MGETCDKDRAAISVVLLSREAMEAHLDEIVAIDVGLFAEMERTYAPGPWNAGNFLMDLPGKWDLSQLVLWKSAVMGFWIVSVVNTTWAFIYRVGFCADARGRGFARDSFAVLFQQVRALSSSLGITHVALEVSHDNRVARRFYERLGFETVRGPALVSYVHGTAGRRSVVTAVSDDCFVTAAGGCELVMLLPVMQDANRRGPTHEATLGADSGSPMPGGSSP